MTVAQSKAIQVTLTGTGAIGGQAVKVINRTTMETHPTATAFSSEKHLNFDCLDFASGYTDGDIIEVSTVGPTYGTTLITLSGGKAQTATLASTATSSTLPQGGN